MSVTTFALLPLYVLATILISFFGLTAIIWLYNFVFRQNTTYPIDYNYNKLLNKLGIKITIIDIWFVSFLLSVCFFIVVVFGAVLIGLRGPSVIDVSWLFVFFVPFIPVILRFIVDVCRSLKLNHKTGDSERILKLEQELENLKSRSNTSL